MKNKNKKIAKWILIILGLALAFYLISQSGDGNFLSVTVEQSSSLSGGGGSGGVIR